ncbi:AAA family ATPase [Pseudooceanicola nanhaiensis]|uniref:bifunctional aminoglycoside phosphotransferase/ATP-binding protein n=1 Tax=Pseudooceanicola nanhaiensis TaxID=375761 RepID=UPI001CD4A206|nr:bifunctional aminoglycoside phosphotransferase/ATP-binding protein [Pseudooceanicola nanhaiensis]MCA0920355.1 AAA family ATPase [Pseudooceanicola nanhaiensis]
MTQSQDRTIAFLSDPASHCGAGPVEVIETHGAYIFLCGRTALKLKRAVHYDYMDLSTVEKRHRLLLRELELNRPAAPMLYRDVLPVTEGPEGLSLGGTGTPVDYVLRMWRFPAEEELDRIAAAGGFDGALADATGAAVALYHRATPLRPCDGAPLIGDILDELGRVFAEFPEAASVPDATAWLQAARSAWTAQRGLLTERGAAGHVRRAHGDLHLRNIVRINGAPVPIDALEFDETLGTCDLLYDIAFLVMDLLHRDLAPQACRTLSAWLREMGGTEDSGLAALPLFLSVRAAIRAMVLLQTDAARGTPGTSEAEIAAYLRLAQAVLAPAAPVLVAVGGLSGSGKSVLARALAPGLGRVPGAVWLASDLERKAGRDMLRHLAQENYSEHNRTAVYDRLFARAGHLLAAGQSVLLDATFLDRRLRGLAEATARTAGVPFHGFWMEAPEEVLRARVTARCGDASDADITVLEIQLAQHTGAMSWHRIDASGPPEEALQAARALLD